MRIFELFERRADVMEMLLFAYAVAVASLVCIHMPIFGAGAVILLVLALLLAGYGLWWMSLPDTRNASLFFGLLLLGLFLMTGVLVAFGSEIAAFSVLKLHNSVTEERFRDYRFYLSVLFLLHTLLSAAVVYVFYLLFRAGKHDLIRLFFLHWASMPAVFVLMSLYGLFLPLT